MSLSAWVLIQRDWCSYKKKKEIWTQRQICTRKRWHGDTEGEDGHLDEVTHLQDKECRALLENIRSQKREERSSPRALRDSMALLQTPPFQTSSRQNCETIPFCCLKPPRFCYFVMQALENTHNSPLVASTGSNLKKKMSVYFLKETGTLIIHVCFSNISIVSITKHAEILNI